MIDEVNSFTALKRVVEGISIGLIHISTVLGSTLRRNECRQAARVLKRLRARKMRDADQLYRSIVLGFERQLRVRAKHARRAASRR